MANLTPFGRVLVTGATGFLGGHVVDRLMRAGIDVVAVGRDPHRLATLKCHTLKHDLSRPFVASNVPNLDAIVHCAALSAPFGKTVDFMRANVDGTQNILNLARAKDVSRLVHISTPSIYFSYSDQLDVPESYRLPRPVNSYAKTKAMAETLVLDHLSDRSIILRPRAIYGPGDTALLPRVLRAAKTRPLPLLRGGAAEIDLTYVDDVVDAIMAALEAPIGACGEAYNISGGEVIKIRNIVKAACEMAGVVPRWRTVPLPVAMMAAGAIETVASWRPTPRQPVITRYGLGLFAYRQSLDLTKAQKHLQWTPQVSFCDGLNRTFEALS